MKKCPTCNKTQNQGRFCAEDGTRLEDVDVLNDGTDRSIISQESIERPAMKRFKMSKSNVKLSNEDSSSELNSSNGKSKELSEERDSDPYEIFEKSSSQCESVAIDENELSSQIQKIDVVDNSTNDAFKNEQHTTLKSNLKEQPSIDDKKTTLTFLKPSIRFKSIDRHTFFQSQTPKNITRYARGAQRNTATPNVDRLLESQDKLTVQLHALIPKSCFTSNDSHVRLEFYLESTNQKIEFNIQQKVEDFKKNMITVIHETQIPREMISKNMLTYVYYVEEPSKDKRNELIINKVYEASFMLANEIRLLEITDLTEKNPRNETQLAQTRSTTSVVSTALEIYEQYDGVVLFGDEKHDENAFKSDYIECVLPKFDKRTREIQETLIRNELSRVIKRYQRVYECLCSDNTYRHCFNEFLTGYINVIVEYYDSSKTHDCHSNYEYACVMTLFYLAYLFELKAIIQNGNFMERLLKLHCVANKNYFNEISNAFESVGQLMVDNLRVFLIDMNKKSSVRTPFSFNALLFAYSLGKSFNNNYKKNDGINVDELEGNKIVNKSNKVTPIHMLIYGEKLTDWLLLERYKELFELNASFSILFLNYFGHTQPSQLKIILENGHISLDAQLLYMQNLIQAEKFQDDEQKGLHTCLTHIKTESKRLFDESSKKKNVRSLVSHFYKSKQTQNKEGTLDLDRLRKTCHNLHLAIMRIPLEWRLICGLIEIFWIFYDVLFENQQVSRRILRNESSDDVSNIYFKIQSISKIWFDNICTQHDIQITYGLSTNPFIHEQHKQQSEQSESIEYMEGDFENDHEILSLHHIMQSKEHFISEEPLLVDTLLNLDFPRVLDYRRDFNDFIRKKFLEKHLHHSKLESLVVVRAKLDELIQTLNLRSNDLIAYFDNTIHDRLMNEPFTIDNLLLILHKIPNDKIVQKHVRDYFMSTYDALKRSAYGFLCANGVEVDATLLKRYVNVEILIHNNAFQVLNKFHYQSRPIFDEKMIQLSKEWLNAFKSALIEIKNGHEIIYFIRLIEKYSKNGSQLLQSIDETHEIFDLLMQCRSMEITSFETYYSNIRKFVTLCNRYENTCDMQVYKEKCSKIAALKDEKLSKLNEFVRVLSENEITSNAVKIKNKTFIPRVEYFIGIDNNLCVKIQEINAIESKNRQLFDDYFKKKCKELAQKNKIKIDQILNEVYPNVLTNLKEVARRIDTGEMKLSEIREYNEFYGDKMKMIDEFRYICGYFKYTNYALREKQINLYFKFEKSVEGAHEINEIRKKLNLTDKFTELNKLLSKDGQEKATWNLNTMDSTVEKTVNVLSMMDSEEKLKCLRDFVESMHFVQWLRRNTKSIIELNFLVDLTSASTNEPNADKDLLARALKDAGTAFAPLIYELQQNVTFHQFMAHCIKVWNFLQEDRYISRKLREVADKLDKLDEIKLKGNVEVSTLKQAKSLNERGVFIIKNHQNLDLYTLSSIDTLIQININDPKMGQKSFDFAKLKEIQNILMLVARKRDKSVTDDDETITLDYFIEIFDGVIRLSQVFLKLVKSGCLLFDQFEARIYCDSCGTRLKSLPNLELLLNRTNKCDDVSESTRLSVNNVCQFMESCLQLWQEHVVDLRNRYNSLNYFTINQIVFMRSIVERMLTNHHDHESVQKMRFILNNLFLRFNEKDVKVAYEDSKRILSDYQSDNMLKKYSQQIAEFIRKMASENQFDTNLVRRAVELYGIGQESNVLQYCLENDGLEWEEKVEVKPLDNYEFKLKTQKLWDDFLLEQNDPNNSSKLSIHRLAIMLELLQKSGSLVGIQRKVPGYLSNRGCPNLIICPKLDQISVALSIYLHSPECPLPSNDEVLFCTKDTTSEEVENFFRIAVNSSGAKIYTIINIQELNYDTSYYVDKKFNSFKTMSSYILVVVCASEKSTQSILVSSFSKFKIKPILSPLSDIQKYLSVKFRERDASGRVDLAANCDPQQYCVRGLLSEKSGCGKTQYVKNLLRTYTDHMSKSKFGYNLVTIKSTHLNTDREITRLFEFLLSDTYKHHATHLYHFDIAHEVLEDVDSFLFNLLVLGYLKHSNGLVWRRSRDDLYLIEIMPPLIKLNSSLISQQTGFKNRAIYHMTLNYIPQTQFRDPKKYLYDLENDGSQAKALDSSFNRFYTHDLYQCVCQYLKIIKENPSELSTFKYYKEQSTASNVTQRRVLTELDCLKVLLNNSVLKNPSWSEIHNFVTFLNEQFRNTDGSFLIDLIPGLNLILIKCIELMSYDFALPGLNICEETPGIYVQTHTNGMDVDENDQRDVPEGAPQVDFDLNRMVITRRWERLTHPYILFNADKTTLTFMGLYLCRRTYKFLEANTEQPITDFHFDLSADLKRTLLTQRVPIYKNFNQLPTLEKVTCLRNVMGLNSGDYMKDSPDKNYELTIDNCLKMMAIYMRFRCDIPVVIMGESGCGKTRLIKFLCDLHVKKNQQDLKTLVHVKVHGGTTSEIIEKRLREAESLSQSNYTRLYSAHVATQLGYIPVSVILFFDEANTTDAIGLIKEIMCDRTCNGKQVDFTHGLKVIAACNPYKKHSEAMIQKLEQAGLGFCKSINETKEKLGHIPMRQLVYRVHPLPASMLPLVWDFGQLNNDVEKVYIKKMLTKARDDHRIPSDLNEEQINKLADLLATSQDFMRQKNDECSFVSLRDIERVIKVASWFYQKQNLIFTRMNVRHISNLMSEDYQAKLLPLTRSFVLALAVCYHASLQTLESRSDYRRLITQKINLENERDDWFQMEILKCEHVFLDEIELNKNIARNAALLENVFMMTICVELRIPLFIVGKPGSSKSLAKSIVAGAMQGKNSKSEFFKQLKEAYFVNFQCSPLTTPEMIVKAFDDAAKFQKDKNLDTSVAVVNLDEIGLAEASDSMPLKALHPLLEEGTDSDDCGLPYQKVGVIGISNWALDPAKMNRGLFVSRGEPDTQELIESTKGIFKYDPIIFVNIEGHIEDIARAYLELCRQARETKREFFGLRDFYSLIKMIYWFCSRDKNLSFTWNKLEHSVRRNFSGLDISPIEPFLKIKSKIINKQDENDPKSNPIDLVQAALRGDNIESNSRYLLLLTENYAVLDIVQNYLINIVKTPEHSIVTIFGSSFHRDQQYTEVCRNISRIKQCMEFGNTIILLNFDNLYESLYDALNQYYHYFAGQKFVDLGLGTHRVKCSVHENFRLIVIAEKNSVYDTKRFPIPLLNRLEKHYLSASTMLNNEQDGLVQRIKEWINKFCRASSTRGRVQRANQVFVGYHDDTVATLVLYCTQSGLNSERVIEASKKMLLQCVTADSIARLSSFTADLNKDFLWHEYFVNQKHSSLGDMLNYHLANMSKSIHNNINSHLLQVTTHSRLLVVKHDLHSLSNSLGLSQKFDCLSSCILNSFDTQQQFVNNLREFFEKNINSMDDDSQSTLKRLMLVQIDFSDTTASDLISCARHIIVEEFKQATRKYSMDGVLLAFIVNIPRENATNFTGFQVSYWTCYHVDDLDESPKELPSFEVLKEKSLSYLLEESLTQTSNNLPNKQTINLRYLMQKCAHLACSFIKDDNLRRTIHRIELFLKLCSQDESLFLRPLVQRLIDLQRQKESNPERSANWLVNDAANLNSVNQYSTLRKSCQNYLESKLSPLLGYLLAYIDNYHNLDVFNECLTNPHLEWKKKLWLSLFVNPDVVKLNYEDMKSKGDTVEEIKQFVCNSQWSLSHQHQQDNSSSFTPKLPFFWLLSNTIAEYYRIFKESNVHLSDSDTLTQQFNQTIPLLFEKTIIFQELSACVSNDSSLKEQLFKEYINDFVLLNCNLSSKNDLDIIQNAIISSIGDQTLDLKKSLPTIHIQYEQMREKIDLYLKFVQLEPEITEKWLIRQQSSTHRSIEIEACLLCIDLYKKKLSLNGAHGNKRKLLEILQLTNGLQTRSQENIREIKEGYETLKLMHLFIENIDDENSSLFSKLFNVYLRKDVNFKHDKTLDSFQKFLNDCVRYAKTTYFLQDTKAKCCNIIKSSSFFRMSSCGCIICGQCKNAADKKFLKKCPLCSKPLQAYVSFTKLSEVPERQAAYNEFIDSLNTFYFEVLECLVLDNESVPTPAAIHLLLNTITAGCILSEENREFDMEIKSHYRPLLLQMVLKKCEQRAFDYLSRWFDENQQRRDTVSMLFETNEQLAVFFVNCIQDQISQQTVNIAQRIQKSIELGQSLKSIEVTFRPSSKTFDLNTLKNVAYLKYTLGVLAQVASDYFKLKAKYDLSKFLNTMKSILASIQPLTNTVHLYLIKELIRKYGSALVKLVSGIDELNWITPASLIGDNEQTTDKYVILEENYLKAKNAVKETLMRMNNKPLMNYLNEEKQDAFSYLSLVLYKEVTILHKRLNSLNDFKRPIELIESTIKEIFRDQQLKQLLAYLYNELPPKIKVNESYNASLDLSRLLVHFKIALTKTKSKIIKPLLELMINPSNMKDSYFPTMPQDSIFDIQQALLDGRGNDTPKFYACPNGHPYVLFDCGRPWVVLKCKECNAEIGGTSHRLLENNRELKITDSTLKGYCLQEATTLSDNPTAERNLSHSDLHTIRLFIHCALYLAISVDTDGVKQCMLKIPNNPYDFFWAHLNYDLKMIAKTLNINQDEVYIILHHILNLIMNSKQASPIDRWSQKNDRQTWENTFSDVFLHGTFKECSRIINKCTKLLQEDCSNENDRAELYFMAYELIPSSNTKAACVYENELFWKFRPNMSFSIMAIELKNTTYENEFKFLKTFIRMKEKLEIVFSLPAIVRMTNILHGTLTKKIFKDYSQKKSLKDFLISNDLPSDELKRQVERGLEAFQRAWLLSKSLLPSHINQNCSSVRIARINFELNFTIDSKLSYFLPSTSGDGASCYSLIHFLASIHNEFFMSYVSNSKLNGIKSLEISELHNKENIIHFDSNGDLLRIVLANYHYNSKESKLNFLYKNIERQIIERYMQTKQPIDLSTLPVFEYSEEMSDLAVLERLKAFIKQSTLEDYAQKSIYSDFKNINETSEALHLLKTIINFAVSTHANENMKLSDFLRSIYVSSNEKANRVLKINTTQTCELKHLTHLWLILMMKRATLFSLKGQESFDFLDDSFKKPLEHEPSIIFNPQNTISYALVIYQLITFFIYEKSKEEDFQTMCLFSIKDTLAAIDDNKYIISEEIRTNLDVFFPSDIKLQNIYELWRYTVDKMSKF